MLVGHKRDGSPQKHSNQWLKRKELKQELSAGAERDKDKLRAEMCAAFIEQHVHGKRKMSSSQVQAAKILIDKGKPSLQAVEQTTIEPAAVRNDAELVEGLRAIIQAHPDLIQRILGEQAAALQQTPQPVESPHDAVHQDKDVAA